MKICYLCSQNITPQDKVSNDHIVPRQFIKRKQPKVKGFYFAGKLPTHQKCNNEFGPEKYSQKALIVLNAIHNKNCHLECKISENKVVFLNPECFPGFNDEDRKYFNIISLSNENSEKNPFLEKPKNNMVGNALNTIFSVLSKSSAALLLSKKIKNIPYKWRIVISSFYGAKPVNFDPIFEKTQEFEIGTKAWIAQAENEDWIVIYKVNDIILYVLFLMSDSDKSIDLLRYISKGADLMYYQGNNLMGLKNHKWIEFKI